jgi:hypothetical protein
MGRLLAVLIVIALSTACVTSSVARIAIFPPEVVESVWWDDLVDDEPPLWTPAAQEGFKNRIRLSISGISTTRLIIRIDERNDGKIRGRAIRVQHLGRDSEVREIRTFRPSLDQMTKLHARVLAAKLWIIYPEHWVMENDGDICVDGEQIVFERKNADGYRFSEANAQCTAPRALLEVAQLMMQIAGMPKSVGLLQ